MRLKTVVILVLTPLVAGFIPFANADSRTALPESIAQDRPARDKADTPKARPPVKETKESPPWNDFLQAAADGNDASVMRLLKEGAKPDDKSANGWTPLMWAAEAGHVTTVKILLEHGADDNAVGNKGRSALMLAAYRRQHEVVSTLLDNGASPNAADAKGMTALMFACLANDEKSAATLITKSADVNARDEKGFTPLMKVNDAGMVDLLVKNGADVNAKSNDGVTALMTTARNKYTSVIKALLKHGADAPAEDNSGETARDWSYKIDQGGGFMEVHEVFEIFSRDTDPCKLCQACILGREDVVSKLLQKGVDPNSYCDTEYSYKPKPSPLVQAATEGHYRIVKLLLDKGAVIDADDQAALREATSNGHFEVVKLLIERRAVSKKPWPDHYGAVCGTCDSKIFGLLLPHIERNHKGCIESAARRGCSKIVKLLLDSDIAVGPESIYLAATEGNSRTLGLLLARAKEKGMPAREFGRSLHGAAGKNRSKSVAALLDYGADVNQKDPRNQDSTPLMTACQYSAVDAAKVLLEKGADVNAKDKHGRTAMTYYAGRADIVKLLVAHGATDRPRETAEQNKWEKFNTATLAAAVNAGDVKAVKQFLRKGADPNQDGPEVGKILHAAAAKAPGSIVQLLIDHGADLEAGIAGGGDTPLLVAVEKGNLGAAQVLLEHGANIKAYVEPQGDSIDTPTAMDMVGKNDKMRQLLLRFGAEYSELMDPKDFQRGGDE